MPCYCCSPDSGGQTSANILPVAVSVVRGTKASSESGYVSGRSLRSELLETPLHVLRSELLETPSAR